MSTVSARLAMAVGGVFLFLFCEAPARADLFFFKDGFVVEGRAVREGTTVVEDGGAVWMPQGFFFIDDLGRRIYFSTKQTYDAVPKKYKVEDPVGFGASFSGGDSVRPIQRVFDVGDWNAKAQRAVSLVGAGGKTHNLTQRIITLSPTITETQTVFTNPLYNWHACYLTREFDPDSVRTMLLGNTKFIAITPKLTKEEIATRRWRLFKFFAHSDWLDVAEKELDGIARDLPDQKEEVEKNRDFLNELKVQKLFDRIERAYSAGQHERAGKLIKEFPEALARDNKLLTQYRDLRKHYDDARTRLALIHKLFKALLDQVDDPVQQKFFQEAIKTIETELGLEEVMPALRDTDKRLVGRLENFVSLASNARPDLKPAELLSFAVTGWLLGNASSEKSYETCQRLWTARKLVAEHLAMPAAAARQRLVDDYRKGTVNALSPEEFAYLIGLMPPAEPGSAEAGKVEEERTENGSKVTYFLRLPTEYRPHRPYGYPVLFVLHDGNEKPQAALDRWSELADQYGFILVAPKWNRGLKGLYCYTPGEHATVLEVLRELRRQYAVDSDRVFLQGLGEGGTMAYDVGLSHPDQFAGIVPMSATASGPIVRYAANAQYLPIYAVCGDSCEQMDTNRTLFQPMGTDGYPIFLVAYRGRGPEWFGGEVPNAFDWMSRKVRANPVQELGKPGGRPFATTRTTDDRFYWLSTDEIDDRCVNQPPPSWNTKILPATVQATVKEKNLLQIKVAGVRKLTVWFSGNGTVDFDKPVRIVVGTTLKPYDIVPSLATLLEDFRLRGDRQRLFLAKLHIDVK